MLSELIQNHPEDWRKDLEEGANSPLRNIYDTYPDLLHPIVKKFIDLVQDGYGNINTGLIKSLDVTSIVDFHLKALQNKFNSRSWSFHYAYKYFVCSITAHVKEIISVVIGSLTLMLLLSFNFPVAASAIIGSVFLFLYAKILSDFIYNLLSGLKRMVIKPIAYMLAPLNKKIFGIEHKKRLLDSDDNMQHIKAEIICHEARYASHYGAKDSSELSSHQPVTLIASAA